MGEGNQSHTGFSPSMTSCSKELRPEPHPKHLLQITTRTLKEPDFKFELLPLHSPLLRQSLLVSFPPLIDMLKFSGYPYLIRGQPDGSAPRRGFSRVGRLASRRLPVRGFHYAEGSWGRRRFPSGPRAADGPARPNTERCSSGEMT